MNLLKAIFFLVFFCLSTTISNQSIHALDHSDLEKLKKEIFKLELKENTLRTKRKKLMKKVRVLQKKVKNSKIYKKDLNKYRIVSNKPAIKYKKFKENAIYCYVDNSQSNTFCKQQKEKDPFTWIYKPLEKKKKISTVCKGESLHELGDNVYSREKNKHPKYSWIFKNHKQSQDSRLCPQGELYHSF